MFLRDDNRSNAYFFSFQGPNGATIATAEEVSFVALIPNNVHHHDSLGSLKLLETQISGCDKKSTCMFGVIFTTDGAAPRTIAFDALPACSAEKVGEILNRSRRTLIERGLPPNKIVYVTDEAKEMRGTAEKISGSVDNCIFCLKHLMASLMLTLSSEAIRRIQRLALAMKDNFGRRYFEGSTTQGILRVLLKVF